MGAPSLTVSIELVNRMRTQLVEEYGLDPDDAALVDTIDGETDLGDLLATMLRVSRENEAFAGALGDIIAESTDRKQRLLKRANAIRKTVAWAGQEAGLPTLTRPDMTVSFTMAKPSLVGEADASKLPDDLVRVTRSPDKTAIKSAIQAGRAVEGYAMSNGHPSVTVRWR